MMDRVLFLTLMFILVSGCQRQPTTGKAAPDSLSERRVAININTASADELTRIPHIGDKLAAKIIEHRKVHGPFRRVEHLMLIQGISDKRFRKLRPLVRVE
jgi:competence ComEA-like helix-hairpin-helix protein